MTTDLLGPASAPNAVTTRVAEYRAFGTLDTWFRDCSSPAAGDGTVFQAAFFNAFLANLRALIRGNGATQVGSPIVVENNVDGLLLAAVQQMQQRARAQYAVAGGTANAITVNPTPQVAELIDGLKLNITFTLANTGATQLNASGLGLVPLTRVDGSALQPGDIVAGMRGVVICTGTAWQLETLPPAAFDGLVSGADTGAANAVVVATPVPAVTGPRTWMGLVTTPVAQNTGPTTVTLAGVTKPAIYPNGSPLVGGELRPAREAFFLYDGANWQWQGSQTPVLSAPQTYYVNANTGSDSNNGTSPSTPFATIQAALNIATSINTAGFNVNIIVADYAGTYPSIQLPKINGGGTITITGNATSPSNVSIAGAGGAIGSGINVGNYVINGVKVSSSGGGGIAINGRGSNLQLANIEFGACATVQCYAVGSSIGWLGTADGYNSTIRVSGGAQSFMASIEEGVFDSHSPALLFTNSPAYSSAFINISGFSDIVFGWSSITGGSTVTGQKYINYDSKIDTGGKGDSYIPGTIQGISYSGRQEWDGRCRLVVASDAAITLLPLDGNILIIDGIPTAIPAGGISVSNAGLAANTLYYVYAYLVSAANPGIQLSTTAYASDINGRKVKSGDPTQRLVGMIYSGASASFTDTASQRFCINYFNRRNLAVQGPAVSGASITTASYAVVPTYAQVITWADEMIQASITGYASANSAAAIVNVAVFYDTGALGQPISFSSPGANYSVPISPSIIVNNPTEGVHNIAPTCAVNSGTALITCLATGWIRG